MSCLSHTDTDVFENICDQLGSVSWTLDIAFIRHFRNKLYDYFFLFFLCLVISKCIFVIFKPITSRWGLSRGYEVVGWIVLFWKTS